MGKIRIKTFGEEEKINKNKNQEKSVKKTVKVSGLKGGEKVAAVGPTQEELEKMPAEKTVETKKEEKEVKHSKYKEKINKEKKAKTISKRQLNNLTKIKNEETYSLPAAIKLLKELKKTAFDETVELHLRVKEKGLSGQISLPHGTGKKLIIKIADGAKPAELESLIAEIEKGKINFDLLIATPGSMVKLAKVARVLGPRGLMPNPKAGTISDKPNELIEKLSKGQLNYKTESEFPLIHLSIGKISFSDKQLEENILTTLSTIGTGKIISTTLKSTMSPGLRLNLANLS